MGSIVFTPQILADTLAETAGYKAGLILTVEQLCDTLNGTEYPDTIIASETQAVRLRSEEYEDLFYKLLHGIGFTEREYGGFTVENARLFRKYRAIAPSELEGVGRLLSEMWRDLLNNRERKDGPIDLTPFVIEAGRRFGNVGMKIALEKVDLFERESQLNPHGGCRYIEWKSTLALDGLFKGDDAAPELGEFIDQRFINYLYKHPGKLASMHWRKLEQLTSEFFAREGYRVEIGPGSNDDGVDVRIWKPDDSTDQSPLCLIQCKRTKSKIEKLVIKGLHTDIMHHGAAFGLIVTTSELSPGARATIDTRGYPIHEIDGDGLREWLMQLRVVGTGIVRL